MKKRKMMSFVLSVCMVVVAFSSVAVPASADANIATKRAYITSAPFENGICFSELDLMKSAFEAWNRNFHVENTIYECQTDHYINNTNFRSNRVFLNAVGNYFGDSDDNDVNYLFIHCHWDLDVGALAINGVVGNRESLPFSELKQALDNIPGYFVIMFDVCRSGLAIERGNSSGFSENSDNYDQLLLNQFFGEDTRSGEFAGSQKYTVFCSSRPTQDSTAVDGVNEGNAAIAWMRCMGYNPYPEVFDHTFVTPTYGADANQDGIITGKQFGNKSKVFLADWLFYANQYYEAGINGNPVLEQNICYYAHNKMTTAFFNKYPLGDINKDYSANMSDVLKLRQYLAGSATLTSEQLKLADTNQDGSVNTQDLLEFEKYLAEIAT